MKKKLLVAIFGAVLVLGACGGANKTKTEKNEGAAPAGETAAVDVEKIVNSKCISCHGKNLEGASAPALDKVGATYSETEIRDIIINGKNGMPPGLIKGEEADAVAKWLSEKK